MSTHAHITSYNFEVLDEPGVATAIDKVSHRVRRGNPWLSHEDLAQEAKLALATKPRHRVGLFDTEVPNWAHLRERMRRAMLDVLDRQSITEQPTSLSALDDDPHMPQPGELDESNIRAVPEVLLLEGNYTPSSVSALLAIMFEGTQTCFGGVATKGSRRVNGNSQVQGEHRVRRTSTNTVTMVADVRRAWEHSPLSTAQRQGVLLHAMGYNATEAAAELGVSRTAVNQRIAKGLALMVTYLNGKSDQPAAALAHAA